MRKPWARYRLRLVVSLLPLLALTISRMVGARRAGGTGPPIVSPATTSAETLSGPTTVPNFPGGSVTTGSSPGGGESAAMEPPYRLDDLLGPDTTEGPWFRLDDLLGPDSTGGASRASREKGARVAGARHAPPPTALLPSSDDSTKGVLLRRGIAQALAESIDLLSDYRLPRELRFRGEYCGPTRSTSYDPRNQVVLLCFEFVERTYRDAVEDDIDQPAEYARDVTRFAVAHEIGHALIDMFRLPVLGREEDAADQFAAFVFLGHDRPLPVFMAARSFGRSDPASALRPGAFGDAHALDAQREANLRCWLAGYKPQEFTSLAGTLPSARLDGCRWELARLRASWKGLLAPHARL